ncbi:hypothetical protein V1520DRAFT_343382 [Lipomyces starkeyi]|uniref:Uncharacterized protein n=1 Tax=Lipomyces starkeyi NRRL Y-11557 TaxID=675824 RepID=A0A1E3Q8Z7_LIPST|nr:hypothetical protein LIPSTDRAFT_247086 [Lipomyces starkeyi NRRL Y-11557]
MAAQVSTTILQHSDFDFLPELLELFERVCEGALQPKDLHNEAGRLRIRISRARSLLTQFVVADDAGIDEQTATIEELKDKIAKKRYLLSRVAVLGKAVLQTGGELLENELVFEAEKYETPVKEEIDLMRQIEIPAVEGIPQSVQLLPESQKGQVAHTDEQKTLEPARQIPPQDQQGEQTSNEVAQFDNNNNGDMDNSDMPNWGEDFDMSGEELQETIEGLPGDAQIFGEANISGGEDNDMQGFMQMMQESGMESQGNEFGNNQNDGAENQQDNDVMFMMMNEIPSSGRNIAQQNLGEENMGEPEQDVQIDELAKAMAEDNDDVMGQFMPMDLS